MFRFMVGLVVLSLFTGSSEARVRHHKAIIIADDMGGEVIKYDRRLALYAKGDAPVVIKGECASACARFMMLPNVCAMKGAVFAFHAIWMKDEADVQPEASYADSIRTDTPTALALEMRYDTFHMGATTTRPYKMKTVEPGVRIIYTPIKLHGRTAYQELLYVDADKLIRSCGR